MVYVCICVLLPKYHIKEAKEVLIGEPECRPQFSGAKHCLVEKQDTYQYVSLIPNLCMLLSDYTIIEKIEAFSKCIHTDGSIEDCCDGSVFADHPLFSKQPSAPQIIAYYAGNMLEICHPLGSHVKQHKLGIVFYTYFSSISISAENLASVPIIEKYGLDEVLKPLLLISAICQP